jgi:hypothetical protein
MRKAFHNPLYEETVASLPGPIRGSLGRNRENRLGTRSTTPSWPHFGEWLDPKPDGVDRVKTAR